ncbi:MAG: pilus assembly protein PilP [Candidatus Acidiferrales bacterium]
MNSIASTIAVAGMTLAFASTLAAQTPPPASSAPAQQPNAAHKKTHKAKAAQATATKPAAGAPKAEGQPTATVAARRDPFQSLLNVSKTDTGANLPPGKAGLVIASIRVDGAIKSQSGMIAVVSNPQQRVYFVREGDRLYDGEVEKINLDGVVFRESTKDAFGKPVEREVTKRLYASAGEQQ